MAGLCQYCKHLLGCPLLYGNKGLFDAERLLLHETDRVCAKFDEVGVKERGVRDWGCNGFGLGYLRALHGLPELMMEGLRQGEKDELMYENMPNFQESPLLRSGMTAVERNDVLRYQTDENGAVIVEIDVEGVEHKLARPEYHIKAYACDPSGPIGIDKAIAWAWNINQAVDHILKREAEVGLIVKTKKSATSVSPKQTQESEINMAGQETGKAVRTIIRRNPPAQQGSQPAAAQAQAGVKRAAPRPATAPVQGARPVQVGGRPPVAAAPGRVSNPPTRRVTTAEAPAAVTPRQVTSPAASAPGGGISVDVLESSVFKVVNPMFEEVLIAIKRLDDRVAQGVETLKDCITVVHDIAGQTGGTFQINKIDDEGNLLVHADGRLVKEAPQLFSHPSKVLAYVERTAYLPEHMQTIDAEILPEGYEEAPQEEGAPEEEVQEGED